MSAARSLATGLLWVFTTVLLAVALPALWAQQHLLDRSGFAALAQRAASDPRLQSAVATELTAQVGRLSPGADSMFASPGADSMFASPGADSMFVSVVARAYTASPAFPGQFAEATAFAHRWLFAPPANSGVDAEGRWVVDFAPMLSDVAFAQTLRGYGITVPTAVPIPLTDNAPAALRPGSLRLYGTWGPWLSWTLAALTAAAAALTLSAATNRGKALAALGVSALLVGAAGWGAIEFAQRYVRAGLDSTSGTGRRIADVMVGTARSSMHQWLNLTLIAGTGLVVIGVIVSLLVSLTKRPVQK